MANDKEKNNNQSAPEDEKDGQGENGKKEEKAKDKNKKSHLVRVVFNKSHTPYVQGEMAGLDPELAKKLIDEKVCTKA
jgi:hypothetical protein